MDDAVARLRSMLASGDCCSVALARMGLEAIGAGEDSALRGASALCGGVRAGLLCGALTGAAMMMGIVAPRGSADGSVRELAEWFSERAVGEWGGASCDAILSGSRLAGSSLCPTIVEETYLKAMEIMRRRGLAE